MRPGFKKDVRGEISEKWTDTCLGERTTKVGSGITPAGGTRVYKRSGRPFLRSQNVGWGTLFLDDIVFIDDEMHAAFPETEIHAGDVFLNITGASIGRSALADDRVQRGNVNQHVCIIRTKENELLPRFLNFFLLSAAGQRQIESFQAGGNRQGLNFGQVKSLRLPLPTIREQRLIAEALTEATDLISALDQLIAKKRDLNQAAMEQLLTGRRRLPGFRGKWGVRTLGEIGWFTKGRGIKKDEVVSEGLPCIRYGEIYTHHHIYLKSFNSFITPETAQGSQRIQRGDLLFSGSGETSEEIGKCIAYLRDEEAYAGGDIVIFRPEGQDSKFFGFLMNHSGVAKQKERMGQGDTVVHISARNLARLEIHPPPLAEQTAIAKVLADIDEELEVLELRREKTLALKQGMMQELLTGRTRLV